MWKLIGKPVTQRVTNELAREYAEMEAAPGDRPLSERRLQAYRALLASGQFRPVTWAEAYCKETGGRYRVNGKHTSVMLAAMPKCPDFFVTVECYECDKLEDVAQLYATFDSKMMSRTARDINTSFAAICPELSDVGRTSIDLAVVGLAYHRWGKQYNTDHQAAERAELMFEDVGFIVWLDTILVTRGKGRPRKNEVSVNSRHLRRGGVISAMVATWKRDPERATKFWLAVRDETDPEPQLPTRKLAKYLLNTSVISGGGVSRRGTRTKIGDTREFYVKCLHAWNAWKRGEPTALNYYADKDIPEVA